MHRKSLLVTLLSILFLLTPLATMGSAFGPGSQGFPLRAGLPGDAGPPDWVEYTVGMTNAASHRPGEDLHGADVIFANPALGFVAVRTVDPKGFEKAAARNPNIAYVERTPTVETLTSPDDPYYPYQWGLHASPGIGAEEAWEVTKGSSEVRVAVLDTGIQEDHPDLGPIGPSYNHADGNFDISDCHGHGTRVAGAIAARTDNSLGVAGVAQTTLMVGKVFGGSSCSGTFNNVANAITWAADNGADVISISLGCGTSDCFHSATSQALAYAAARDVLAVCAAGNYGPDEGTVTFPANDPNCMAVSAITRDGNLASFSSRGAEVEIAAPGASILTTTTGSGYAYASGTSLAAPFVSGTAALLRAASGSLSADDIRAQLKDAAHDLGLPAHHQGAGALDAAAALAKYAPEPPEEDQKDDTQDDPSDDPTEDGTDQPPSDDGGSDEDAPKDDPPQDDSGQDDSGQDDSEQDDSNQDDSSQDDAEEDQPEKAVHTEDVSLWRTGRHARAQVWSFDEADRPSSGVQVTLEFCKDRGGCTTLEGTTGSDGSVELRWMHAGGGTYTACVTAMHKSGYTWDQEGGRASNGNCHTQRI